MLTRRSFLTAAVALSLAPSVPVQPPRTRLPKPRYWYWGRHRFASSVPVPTMDLRKVLGEDTIKDHIPDGELPFRVIYSKPSPAELQRILRACRPGCCCCMEGPV